MPLVTFRLYSAFECVCLFEVQWMDFYLTYFLQVGANQLLRSFRAVFKACFFLSYELLCLLLCLFFKSLIFFLFSLKFLELFMNIAKFCIQIEKISLLILYPLLLVLNFLPQRLDLTFLGSYYLVVVC